MKQTTTNDHNGHNGHKPNLDYLILPGVKLDDNDYAALRMRLDLYDDYILARRYEAGRPGPLFAVDPVEVAALLADLSLTTGLLPADCLFWSRADGEERIGVYLKPQVWQVSVAGQAQSWLVPLPGLVFVGQGQVYWLYAVKQRPTSPREQLWRAPAPNMSAQVCRGNAPFPAASAGTIWQAVEAYFSSEFNSHLANGKSRQYPDNILEQWRALHEAGATEYPLDDLVADRLVMRELMETNNGR